MVAHTHPASLTHCRVELDVRRGDRMCDDLEQLAILGWAVALGEAAHRPVTTLALGGRFHGGDLDPLELAGVVTFAETRLPDLERVIWVPTGQRHLVSQ